jgi:hypothetical protein
MEHRRLLNDAWSYNPNLRAEDGSRIPDRRSAFRDFILIPIGFVFATLLTILLITCSAFGQAGSGRIAGSVKDATGAVIPGSNVTLRNTATGVTQTTTGNAEGIFSFPVVAIGQYELDVTANGFNPYRQTTNLKVDVNTALTPDVVMHVVDANETVTVTENTAEVQTADTQIGQTIESKQVVDIPLNGRSYTDLLAVQAGVSPVTTSGAGNTSSGGGDLLGKIAQFAFALEHGFNSPPVQNPGPARWPSPVASTSWFLWPVAFGRPR